MIEENGRNISIFALYERNMGMAYVSCMCKMTFGRLWYFQICQIQTWSFTQNVEHEQKTTSIEMLHYFYQIWLNSNVYI